MKEIKVNASKKYSIYITSDSNLLRTIVELNKIHSVFIVTDENVYNLHKNLLDTISNLISGIYIIQPGEKSKSIETIMGIYDKMINLGIGKKTSIIAFGGGVVGDIAGFVASTYMRGLDLIHIPTTLLAQCDSSIGGKNGFDFLKIKNIIGTFHQPKFIFSEVNLLKTLEERQFINGLAEVIKYGVISDKNLFEYLFQNRRAILEMECDKLIHIVYQTSKIKASIIEKDELDLGERHILNFGHTIGHAIESIMNFEILHGEAIAIGMLVESYMAYKLGYLRRDEYDRIATLIRYFKLPTNIKLENYDELFLYMNMDKKRTTNQLKFALPKGIGNAIITTDLNEALIKDSIKNCLGG
ncbi:3-dehydroquinate synthase [Caloramator mitchellensis]|uniref:3-dehydroquinate synthase n=1 Tax=Caloramator mitchellensis TaxID=908809 RepID=A0A0R3JSV2_CALMK|nr:3-dehydroquinate synthase [Caloramator mitchellensis]KRQ86555.1 3-dehydroquinate synthase [Caloramator mitchellensis]